MTSGRGRLDKKELCVKGNSEVENMMQGKNC